MSDTPTNDAAARPNAGEAETLAAADREVVKFINFLMTSKRDPVGARRLSEALVLMRQHTQDAERRLRMCREELRTAIFASMFWVSAEKVQGSDHRSQVMQQRAAGFAEFGGRSKLFTPDEANDWLDVVWKRKSIAQVAEKYRDAALAGTDGTDAGGGAGAAT